MTGWVILAVALAALLGFGLREWRVHAFHRRVMLRIRRHPGIRSSEVAEELDVTQLRVRCSTKWLEDAGKIVTLPDSGDRRCWPVYRA